MKPRHARISQVSWRELKITIATMRSGNFRTSLTRVTLPRSNPSASPHDVFDIYKFDRIWEKPELKTYEILRPQKILTLIRNWKTISKTDHVCNLMTAKNPWCRPNSLSICNIQLWICCLIIANWDTGRLAQGSTEACASTLMGFSINMFQISHIELQRSKFLGRSGMIWVDYSISLTCEKVTRWCISSG